MMKRIGWIGAICLLATAAALQSCGKHAQALKEPTIDTLWVNPDGTGDYIDARTALLAADSLQREYAYSDERPLTICLSPSVYWIDDPDDPDIRRPEPGQSTPFGLDLRLSHIRLVGMGDGPEEVVLACNRGQTQGADGNFTMLHIVGDDITAEGITFGNYCNVDLHYPLRPELSRPRRETAIVQAQLIICEGDRVVARRCRFISRLNLCPFAGVRRALFEDCYFECTDDALCGSGIYLRCRFTLFSSKPFYATEGTGAIFLDCDLHALTRGEQYLVKAGSPVAMIDCRWTSDDPALRIGWTKDPTGDLRSYQYNLTLNGRSLLIDAHRPGLTIDLTDHSALAAYIDTLNASGYNLSNLAGGDDGWNPTGSTVTHGIATQLVLSARQSTIETGVDTLVLTATPLLPYQTPERAEPATGDELTWRTSVGDEAYVSLQPADDGTCTVVGTNATEGPRTVCVVAETRSGLQAATVVTVKPRQLPAPAFTAMPTLRRVDHLLSVDYTIDRDTHADRSTITWYRGRQADGSDATPIAVTRGNSPLRIYTLTGDDNGSYLTVGVRPQHTVSLTGDEIRVTTDAPIEGIAPRTRLSTDFSTLPTTRQTRVEPGLWTVDCYKPIDTEAYSWDADSLHSWTYGTGIDGAAGIEGLLQEVKGARLMYTPTETTYGDMKLTLSVAPCKSAGQGFGSATGQYMDLCLKMNTTTLTGYGLRIVRTPQSDHAVDFVLIQHNNGIVTRLTDPVTATCYRTTCTISIAVSGNRLTAHVETTARPSDTLPNTVDLAATISPSTDGGIAIQHTGSTGQSATLLRQLDIEWMPRAE